MEKQASFPTEESHQDVYCRFETLQKQCRIYRIYGNHNMEMKGMLGEAMILDNCEGVGISA